MQSPHTLFDRKPLATVGGRWLALTGLILLLAACGGGGSSPADSTPPPATGQAGALSTARSGEVLAYVKSRLQARAPQGTGGFVLSAAPPPPGAVAVVSRSGSLVQEAGVDEEDLIKTDGSRLYTLQPLQPSADVKPQPFARLAVYTLDAAGQPVAAGSTDLALDDTTLAQARGLLLADGLPRVAAIAESTGGTWYCPPNTACITTLLPYVMGTPRVHLQLLDVSQPAALPRPERLTIDGRLIGTRQIGRMLYVVASHSPQFAYDQLPASATAAERQAALDQLRLADVLPKISVNGGAAQALVAETDCWLQPANGSQQVAVTTITAIDLGSSGWARSSRCFVGGTEALYMAPSTLYLATTRNDIQTLANGRPSFAPEMRTDIHKFAVSGSSVAYRGTGVVSGHLGWDRDRTPYRMSEHNGDLRVLTFTGSQGWMTIDDAATVKASPATLTVLRERSSDGSLQPVATLPNAQRPAAIGKPGEQVYGVRFAGDRAYVVTFRRIDPLYVLDLSNPADPRTAGELQVPGFSDWLYPLDGGLLFGVGRDATADGQLQGVKVALFDVRDTASPRLLDSRTHGRAGSMTALDSTPQGIKLQMAGTTTRLALPMLVVTDTLGTVLQQVQRYEVDTTARTLATQSPLDLGSGWADISAVRSVFVGDRLHLLRDGKLSTSTW